MDTKKIFWEESYARNENHMFYPKEECVKFLNRFIKKRKSYNTFQEILPSSGGGG